MNRIFHLLLPILAALLSLTLVLLLVKASRQVAASPGSLEGVLLVTTLEDELISDGDCSLREALEAANTNSEVDACGFGEVLTDTIIFDVTGTITLTSQLQSTAGGPLLIDGGEAITLSGGDTTRVWWVESDSVLTLQNLSVIHSYIAGGDGAGIYSEGTLTIVHSILSGNQATDASGCGGGAIHQQGGRLTVINSTITNNSAICVSAWGGAIVNQFGTALILDSLLTGNVSLLGGGILNFGTMTVTNSTLFDNYAYHEGGAIHNYFGSLTLINSTLSNNNAEYSGALHNSWGSLSLISSTLTGNGAYWGGAIMNQGTMTVTNSTLSGNIADDIAGGIYNTYSGTLMVTNTTLTGNSAMQAGALYNENTLTVTNSIVANSPTGGDCWGVITDGGHNISSDDSCGFLPANGSLPDTDPHLGPLQDNGGPTPTHALLPDSPAIDSGIDPLCPLSDQRGVTRPQDGDEDGHAVCDIGSYELEINYVAPESLTLLGSAEGQIDHAYTYTATVEPPSTTLPLTYTWQAEGQPPLTHIAGLTDAVNFLWELPGIYTMTVNAANTWGTVSDTHQVTITDLPVEGLAATNDGPTLLGEYTTLSATITGGTNVIFTWDFGDGQTDRGQVVTHTYSDVGVYTATVTATNTFNALTETTQVTILPLIYETYLPLMVKDDPLSSDSSTFKPLKY